MKKAEPTSGGNESKAGKGASTLNAKQQRFVDEYLIDLNATQAAVRAGYSAKTANEQGARLLAHVSVQAAIQERMKDREHRTEITQDKVLRYWWELANADAAELSAVHYRCCRHCYGNGHGYQWKDEDEYERACALAEAEERNPPSDDGGYGFNPTLSPHAKCPKCFGEGQIHVHLADTRSLSPAGRLLFDGVKETKFGIEIKTQDRGKALENVAKHLGMFKQDVNLGIQPDNPLADLFAQLAGKTLKPGARE